MNELTQSKDGYIVFDESGTCALAYGAAEKWFKTYDEAINYALEKVTKNCELFKERIDFNSVIVYEGSEEFMHGTHTIPYEKVLFWWKNHKSVYILRSACQIQTIPSQVSLRNHKILCQTTF